MQLKAITSCPVSKFDLAVGHWATQVSISEQWQLFLAAERYRCDLQNKAVQSHVHDREEAILRRSGGNIPAGMDVARREVVPAMPEGACEAV